jgi:hypothetical protein
MPRGGKRVRISSIEQLYAMCERDESTGCLLYPHGDVAPTRMFWTRFRGVIRPLSSNRFDKLFVCHTCDVRRCVNFDHLYLGTHSDNTRDAVERDRFHGGERWFDTHASHMAEMCKRLGIREVPRSEQAEIARAFAAGTSRGELAKKHGLSYSRVYNITRWKFAEESEAAE